MTKNLVPGNTVYGEKKIEVHHKYFSKYTKKTFRLKCQLQKDLRTQSRRSNTDRGIPSDLSLLLPFSVVLIKSTSLQANEYERIFRFES